MLNCEFFMKRSTTLDRDLKAIRHNVPEFGVHNFFGVEHKP